MTFDWLRRETFDAHGAASRGLSRLPANHSVRIVTLDFAVLSLRRELVSYLGLRRLSV